jgi:epoxyqueuosine reductase
MIDADTRSIKDRVIEDALRLGACAVRVAAASPDDRTRRRMASSFERGDFATWRYDGEYARRASDPHALLAGARSVICIAMPYRTPQPKECRPLRGRVSNYAWSGDYHRELRELLHAVARGIDRDAGRPVTAIACDTRPLAERAFAARAGVGWVGKHTNLIAPGAGSFVFLGEIVTSLDLAADAPLRKNCASCTRCVDACPTGALRGDYTIDATRCISDLTQRTDAIPRAMRPLIGDWVWGCDLCQLVCPPNAGVPAAGARWAPHDLDAAAPALVELLQMRNAAFKRRFRKTAMGWRGGAILRRNAAVALGNALDRSTVGALAQSLERDSHPMVRAHVAWALGRIGSPPALRALRERYAREPECSVREEIDIALEVYS